MRQLKYIFTIALIAVMVATTFSAGAKSRTTKRSGQVSFSRELSVQDVIDIYTVMCGSLQNECPFERQDGTVLRAVSFKNKCMKFELSISQSYLDLYDTMIEDFDISIIGDEAINTMVDVFACHIDVPKKTFAKTSITYALVIKDEKGNVIYSKSKTNKDIILAMK